MLAASINAADIVFEDGDLKADTDTLYVDSVNDRVGIGTINPDTRLHILATTYDDGMNIENTNSGSVGATFRLYQNSSSPAANDYLSVFRFSANSNAGIRRDYAAIYTRAIDVTNTSEDGYMAFQTIKAGTLTEQMRIDNNGNVGIGTNSPTSKLEISGPGGTDYNALVIGENGADSFVFSGNFSGTGADGNFLSLNGYYGNEFMVWRNNKVGIGESSPNSTLDVAGNTNIDGNLHVGGSLTGNSPLFFGDDPHSSDWFGTEYNFTTYCQRASNGIFVLTYYGENGLVEEYDSEYCNHWYGKKRVYQQNIGIQPEDILYENGEWQVIDSEELIGTQEEPESFDYGYG